MDALDNQSLKTLNDQKIALQVNNFSKKYARQKNYAVKDVSFNVYPGEFHGFIGANGAGKTTTIKSLIGAYAKYKGKINIFGHRNISKKGKKHLGYIPEQANFPKNLNALEYIAHMAAISGMNYQKALIYAKKTLKSMGLTKFMLKKPNNFSSGQKKKVLLAQALVNNPDVIIMDEPAANLDPQTRNDFFNILKNLQKKGKAIFISSHILAELDNYVDAITILDAGQVVFSGKKSDLVDQNTFNYEISFDDQDAHLLFNKWAKKAKITTKENEQNNSNIYLLKNQETINKALVFITKEKLAMKQFKQIQPNLQQAYDHFIAKKKGKNKLGVK